jgi:hypothetical protein
MNSLIKPLRNKSNGFSYNVFLSRYTLDEFGTARRSTVVRGFIDALTRGGPGGTPRPIEMHSHDPLRYSNQTPVEDFIFLQGHLYLHVVFTRYVGDMLAWLHQATASEKEHLEALLKQVTTQGRHTDVLMLIHKLRK